MNWSVSGEGKGGGSCLCLLPSLYSVCLFFFAVFWNVLKMGILELLSELGVVWLVRGQE